MSVAKYPDTSPHARVQFTRYTGDAVSDPSGYWPDGIVIDDPNPFDADEARYLRGYDVVLLRKDSTIVTVINHDENMRGAARDQISRIQRRMG